MTRITGTGVFGGIAFGRLQFLRREKNIVKRERIEDTAAEVRRFEQAKAETLAKLGELYEKALAEVGETGAMLFEIHQMMLEDGDYNDSITNIITAQQVSAEYAVATTADNFAEMFSSMEDEYMQGRAADVRDISERLLGILSGAGQAGVKTSEPVILAADDLAPSETVQLDKEQILAFVTRGGSTNSHTAILSRMMGIPAVIGAGEGLAEQYDGREAIVDGFTGDIYIDPDEQTRAEMQNKADEHARRQHLLENLKGKDNVTPDGKRVDVFANIGGVADIAPALQNDAGGVGLFRSEFLYLEAEDYPTEAEQLAAYKLVAENMAGRKVVIRTLDIGADKQIGYFGLPEEENPAMGYRAIRICLDRPEVFKTQLRALYRASAFGNIAIMFPMITSVEEIVEIKEIIRTVKLELDAEGLRYAEDVELGVMIETPAAVMVSDDLAGEVDFFSIGTNDLVQYTLAVDRQNPKLGRYYNPSHKGVLRMIKLVVENGHRKNIWVGICGELAADLALTETFLAMGVDELSVSPPYILPLRDKIRSVDTAASAPAILAAL